MTCGKNMHNELMFLPHFDIFCDLLPGLLVGRGKKSQISRDFQGQIRGKMADFAGIFEASFAEKRLGASRTNFAGKRLLLR